MFEEVNCFKYLRSALLNDGSCLAEFHIRVATVTAAMARLNRTRYIHLFATV